MKARRVLSTPLILASMVAFSFGISCGDGASFRANNGDGDGGEPENGGSLGDGGSASGSSTGVGGALGTSGGTTSSVGGRTSGAGGRSSGDGDGDIGGGGALTGDGDGDAVSGGGSSGGTTGSGSCFDGTCAGTCSGSSCGDDWVCNTQVQVCTDDIAEYCGCDGMTFTDSGSCPRQAYSHRGACETTPLGDCNPVNVQCRRVQPVCERDFYYPEVVDGCWGECVPVAQCSCTASDECPDPQGTDETVCISSKGVCSPQL